MGSSKKQTIGYRYYFTLQMGLGRGPINELVEIRVGDKMAWFGSVTESSTVSIQAGDLFGGDKGEGGIEGTLDVCMGEPTQGLNARMVAMRGTLLSALRGVTTLVFDGLICSLNPYPKTWKMRCRRSTKGWDREVWYPERANILIYDNYTTLEAPEIQIGYIGNPDLYTEKQWQELYNSKLQELTEEIQLRRRIIYSMNPAHILIEIATNKSWGRGMPDDQIDFDSYTLAADVLYCEGFGLCQRWNRQGTLDEVLTEIINTIGAMQYVSRLTGKLTLRLIRDDYDVEALPVFTRTSGLLSIEDSDQSTGSTAFNEIVVKYRTPLTGNVASVRVQNLGSAMSDGGISSNTVEYLSIPDRNLALRVAARDVRSSTGDVSRLKLTFDQRGYQIEPGTVFVLSDPETGVGQMVMRAITVESEDYVKGTITINCLTDIYGLPDTTYVSTTPVDPVGASGAPQLPKAQRMVESTYRQVYQSMDKANFEALDPDVAFVGTVAVRGSSNDLRYDVVVKADGEDDFGDRTGGEFSPWVQLAEDMDTEAFMVVYEQGDLTGVDVGECALLDDEIVKVTSIDVVSKTVLLARGCLDTIPAPHSKDTFVYFYENGSAEVEREFLRGETIQGKVLPQTSSQVMAVAQAQTVSVTAEGRFLRPYPPAGVQLNGESIFTVGSLATGDTLTWSRRNRVTQADTVVDTDAPDRAPEVGQTVTVRLSNADTGAVIATWADIAGTSQVLDFSASGDVLLEVFSVRDGEESLQSYSVLLDAGGVSSNKLTTEAGVRLITETGDRIIEE